MAALIPVTAVGLVLWALVQWAGAQLWHLLIAVVFGLILSGTVLRPDIDQILSQLSGGRLH